MTRKTKTRLTLEAEQDAQYRALSAEQRNATQTAIYEATYAYGAEIEMHVEPLMHRAIQVLVKRTRELRAKWGRLHCERCDARSRRETDLWPIDAPGCVEEAVESIAELEAAELMDAPAGALQ